LFRIFRSALHWLHRSDLLVNLWHDIVIWHDDYNALLGTLIEVIGDFKEVPHMGIPREAVR